MSHHGEFRFEKLLAGAVLPTVETIGSCGHDFRALESFKIDPGETVGVRTGVSASFPRSHALFLKSRSGLVKNYGITTEAGVIDSDYYPHEIIVLLRNGGKDPYRGKAGDKISQGVFVNVYTIPFSRSPSRGGSGQCMPERTGGFGSTGR